MREIEKRQLPGVVEYRASNLVPNYKPEPYHADADETVQCPNCGLMDDTDASFCDQCGYKLTPTEAYSPEPDEVVQCPSCDLMNAPDASYCDQCGFKLVGASVEVNRGIGVLQGYAAVFNRTSQNLGGFVEQVHPDAFNKTLADAGQVLARFNHDENLLLGTTEARTLRLSTDNVGLHYEVDLPDTNAGRDVAALAKRGDLSKSSFAFQTMADEWGVAADDTPLRTLMAVRLIDVAPVISPAYRDTTSGLRGLAERLNMSVEAVQAIADKGELRSLFSIEDEHKGGGDVPAKSHTSRLAILRQQLVQWH